LSNPLISVVVPVSNGGRWLPVALKALEAQQLARGTFECIVVDDGSGEQASALLSGIPPDLNLSVIHACKGVGQSILKNLGWRNARGELIAVLQENIVPAPGWLEAYLAAFESTAADAVAGPTYCLQKQAADCGGAENAGRLNALFRQYRQSVVCGYACMTSNVALTKAVLKAAGGFEPLLRHGEDLDLGIRIALLGCRFEVAENARAYHLDCSLQHRDWPRLDRHAFLYRHPYRLVATTSLWLNGNTADRVSLSELFPAGLLDIAASELDRSGLSWKNVLARVSPDELPGCFNYSHDAVVQYLSEAAGISEDTTNGYLALALAEGLIVRRSSSATHFDIHHTSNWLGKRTPYQEHWLRNASFARTHPTPKQRDVCGAQAIQIHCNGRYEISLDRTPGVPWDSVALNISVPVEHPLQTNLQLQLISSELELYFDRKTGLIMNVPASIWFDCGPVVCEFACDITEGSPQDKADPPLQPHVNGTATDPEQLLFTFPHAYLQRARSLLDYIVGEKRADAENDVRRIYEWILENVSYASTPLPDYSILDTGLGTCVHLARLFTNLARLRGIPAREQCGALMMRGISDAKVATVASGYSPFAHTWAEIYLDGRGWLPVEFLAMGYGEWRMTNPCLSTQLRAEMASQAPGLVNYYFGGVDPYRIYSHSFANKVASISVSGSSKNHKYQDALLAHMRHRLTCSFSFLHN
jgi:glycosyltransferase involved in cell wall biosynthesis